jgi:hypothetical protein
MALRAVNPLLPSDYGQCEIARSALAAAGRPSCVCNRSTPDLFPLAGGGGCFQPTLYGTADFLPEILDARITGYVAAPPPPPPRSPPLPTYRVPAALLRDEWKAGRPSLVWRNSPSGCGKDGHIVVVGGVREGKLLEVEVFDPAKKGGRWEAYRTFACGAGKQGHCAAYYAIGGANAASAKLEPFVEADCKPQNSEKVTGLPAARENLKEILNREPSVRRSVTGEVDLVGPAADVSDLECGSQTIRRFEAHWIDGRLERIDDGSESVACTAKGLDGSRRGEEWLLTYGQSPQGFDIRAAGETFTQAAIRSQLEATAAATGCSTSGALALIDYPQIGQSILATADFGCSAPLGEGALRPRWLLELERELLDRANEESGIRWTH